MVQRFPQPALQASEWVDTLNLIASQKVKDEIALKRLENEVQKVISSSHDALALSSAHQALGTIFALRGDPENMYGEYGKAFRYSPGNRNIELNYAVDLTRIGNFDGLRKACKSLFTSYPDDLLILQFLLQSYIKIGEFILANDVRQRLEDLNLLDQAGENPVLIEFCKKFSERIKSAGISSDDISKRFDTALTAINAAGYIPNNTGYCIDPENQSVSIRFMIDDTPENIAEASFLIAEAIMREYENPMCDFFTFSTMSPRKNLNAHTS